jgi:Flp pilus assembly protein TadD
VKKSRLAIGAALFVVLIGSTLTVMANMGAEGAAGSDDPNAIDGKKAIEAQDWKRAVELLSKAANTDPNNADVQNWLGFAQRKSGNLPAAFSAYNTALKLNPQLKAAHEYIGEAYLLTGDLGKAEQHLTELKRLCTPIPCEEYKDLRRALEDYKKKKK